GLVARLVDDLLKDLAHHALAVHLLQERQRRLALAEALEVNFGFHLGEARIQLGVKLGRRHLDRELALKALSGLFNHFHRRPSLLRRDRSGGPSLSFHPAPAVPRRRWCGWRELNPHGSPRWNLNPVRLPVPPHPRRKPRSPPRSQNRGRPPKARLSN